jgi:hypothetical protein
MTREPDIVAMARAAEKDERLSDGALYGKLADEIERLRALAKELADDLEAEIDAHYAKTKDYPSELRRYERDMDSVRRARAALEPKP